MKIRYAAVLLICAWALPALAGDRVSVRLVEATNDGKGDGAGLEDVVKVLKKNLSYQNYALVSRTSIALPAKGDAQKVGGYSVICSGTQANLSILVKHGSKKLLQTTVKLDDGTPLVMGGFPSGKGKMVLVFVAE